MGRTIERISEGESFQVDFLSRNFNSGQPVTVFKCDGSASGAVSISAPLTLASAPVVNGVTALTITGIKQTTIAGVDASGSAQSIVLSGVKVGDRVVGVVDMVGGTVGGDLSADFETSISVAGHISQLNTNLSAVTKILVTVLTLS